MFSCSGQFQKFIFGISFKETTVARRGFRCDDPKVQQQLEEIGQTFLQGYHAALKNENLDVLSLELNSVKEKFQGFAYEGAAMGLAVLDQFTPWKKDRLKFFLKGSGKSHTYMIHVGFGWALARLRLPVEKYLLQMDPLLRWLVVDGYGFHEGYFHWKKYIKKQATPEQLSGYARQIFDQGLGRSLWFVDGADIIRISATIASFAPSRQADLWSGIGLACTYAGGVEREAIQALVTAAGSYRPQLAQGAAFAAKARQLAGNFAVHTNLACEILCGMSAETASKITDIAMKNLEINGALPVYEVWRQRIQNQFAAEEVKA